MSMSKFMRLAKDAKACYEVNQGVTIILIKNLAKNMDIFKKRVLLRLAFRYDIIRDMLLRVTQQYIWQL